jgi:glycosyltransferase involved in cell wall biosynthesis
MPRVSILLTCYNHLRHLKVAVECLRSQTFTDFEVIALDDGSTDGTREWLSNLAAAEPGFPLLLEFNPRNLGTYGTLNRGLELANGEFVAVYNDDDVWMPEKLARQVAMLDERPEVGLVHTSGWFIDDEGGRLEPNPLGFPWPKTGTGDVLHELVFHNKIIASSVMARRECFEKVGAFNTSYFGSGDWEMWYRIAEEYQVGHLDQPLTLYRVHAGSASHHTEKVRRDDERIREWMIGRMNGYGDRWSPSLRRRLLAHQYACVGTARTWNGDARGGRAMYLKSLQVMPWRAKSVARYLASFMPRKWFRALR